MDSGINKCNTNSNTPGGDLLKIYAYTMIKIDVCNGMKDSAMRNKSMASDTTASE